MLGLIVCKAKEWRFIQTVQAQKDHRKLCVSVTSWRSWLLFGRGTDRLILWDIHSQWSPRAWSAVLSSHCPVSPQLPIANRDLHWGKEAEVCFTLQVHPPCSWHVVNSKFFSAKSGGHYCQPSIYLLANKCGEGLPTMIQWLRSCLEFLRNSVHCTSQLHCCSFDKRGDTTRWTSSCGNEICVRRWTPKPQIQN